MTFSPELLMQLVNTFKSEVDEGVTAITNGLLDLEKNQNNAELRAEYIENILRTAHNLKGSARGLGINSVADIAHVIETIFTEMKTSNSHIKQVEIDSTLDAIDTLQQAMDAYIDKKPFEYDLESFKSTLKNTAREPDLIKKERAEFKKYKREKSDSVRISLNVIDKLSELSEQVQANKIEVDEHSVSAKYITKLFQQLNLSWNDMKKEINQHNSYKNTKINKVMTQINDELMNITLAVNKLSSDLTSNATEYVSMAKSVQDEVALLRLVPVNNLLGLLPRYVRDIANELNKEVVLEVHGDNVYIDKYVLEGLKDPINHILRNAIDHGIELPAERLKDGKSEVGTIVINVKDAGHQIIFEISDDGAGIDISAIKNKLRASVAVNNIDNLTESEVENYIFQSGFSTKANITSISGRGVGLDVVKKNVAALKGNIIVKSITGQGTTFIITTPLSISSERGLIVMCNGQPFVLPTHGIERIMLIHKNDVIGIEGGHAILVNEKPIVVLSLANVLGISQLATVTDKVVAVVLKSRSMMVSLTVDQIIGEREIVIKPIHEPKFDNSCIAGAALLDRNQIGLVLSIEDLIHLSINTRSITFTNESESTIKHHETQRILVVDDSITTRTMEKNILESKNFHVTTAVNGQEAWDLLQKQSFSLVITDINMPIMDGFELTNKIKSNERLASLPVIIVTSLGSDAEKARGLESGADAYIIKNEFESSSLLQMIDQLL